jgi:class 3 adenylate cyclase/tetratricopeptide (TPR) repeat protein
MPEGPALPEGTVTVLFTDLVGSTQLNQTLGDEAAGAVEREIETVALDRVGKHRGVVVKDMGDGLMAAFQSARRAVACAQEIQRAVARRNREAPDQTVRMRIGLHTGEVVDDNGSMSGETVIVAKRIEGLAPPGGIFASDTTHGVLGTARSELQDRGEFELKGIATPWHLYEIPWADEQSTGVLAAADRTPFVGRSAERERLAQHLERAREGSGSLVLIGGEAGIGKTRLGEEIAERARGAGCLPLSGRCRDMEGAEPYLPLIQQIEQAARSVPPEVLRQALGENAPEIAKLMPELRQRYDDIPEPVELPPEQERRYLLHGVVEFVDRATRGQPLVLTFEDLHLADDSTLLLLRHLAQRVGEMPILVLGTYRHTELDPGRPFGGVLPELLRERRVEEFLLGRLDEAGVTALIEARAGKRPPTELVSLVYAETEGNPFFVEEVFRHLLDAGKLFDDAGEFLSGIEVADTEVPRGVGLVIGHRLDRVSDTCRGALTPAAVLGRTFRFDLVALLRNDDEDELLDAMEEAEKAALIEDASEGREARYRFVHEQIRQTLLSTLSTPRRQRLHLRAAAALEKLYGSEVEERAVEVAHHLHMAGTAAEPKRAARYLELAGRRTMAALAFEDALRHFDAARTVLPRDEREDQGRLLGLRALALRGATRIEESLEAFASALDVVPEGAERENVLYERARLLLDLFRGREALADLDALLAHALDSGDEKRELQALLGLARASYILSLDNPGEYAQRARDAYEKAYERAKELGDKRAMAQALIPTTWFTDYWFDYRDQAIANLREAAEFARELGDEDLLIESRAALLRTMAPAEQAVEGEAVREALEDRRDPLRLKEHYFWLMWQYWVRAELERCVEICNAGIALADQLGSEPVQYPTIKAFALIDLGRFDEAWESLQQEVADEEHRFGAAVKQLGTAVYLERVGALDEAVVTAKKALAEAAALNRTWMQRWLVDLLESLAVRTRSGESYPEVGEYAPFFSASSVTAAEQKLANGEPEEAFRMASEFSSGMEQMGMRRTSMSAAEIAARSLEALGRSSEAASLAEKTLSVADDSGFRTLAWRLRALRARTLDDPELAKRERVAARAIVREIAEQIPDAAHRARFEADPLAAEILKGEN